MKNQPVLVLLEIVSGSSWFFVKFFLLRLVVLVVVFWPVVTPGTPQLVHRRHELYGSLCSVTCRGSWAPSH